jgi:hypothetical protein
MPVRSNPQQATAKWVQNLSASSERMTAGANAVTKAPGLAAAAAKQKWLQRVTASVDKFAANSAAVTLQQWQQAYVQIGVPRVAQGAQAKQGKVQDFMTQFLPFLQRGVATIDAMPSVTLEDNIARASAMIRYNAKFKKGVTTS